MKAKDLTGNIFGRLTVINFVGSKPVGKDNKKKRVWNCLCECGTEVEVITECLTRGTTKSCGCYQKDRAGETSIKHGLNKPGKRHKDYRTWCNAKNRIFGSNPKYHTYKGKGMYDEWVINAEAFVEYIRSLPGYGTPGLSIDRIDNSKGYYPGNLRWATAFEQVHNRG